MSKTDWTYRTGTALRIQRLRQNLSQQKLAEKADVTQAAISTIERGKSSVNLNTLTKVSNALGVTLSELFREIEMMGTPEQVLARVKHFLETAK
ncbi:MAG TPA: helix-turn-helix transcriptional regulator [Candidatus Hydrogenedentes bacterium]|nr:helix-turn-helix transcriptional regulator [Candidatus Hydrogenedentota bacterium]